MFKKHPSLFALTFGVLLVLGCGRGGSSEGGSSSEGDRLLQGGDTTSSDRTTLAFEHPAANLTSEEDELHTDGDGDFGSIFVTPPATFNAGLGPFFNNTSCETCHTKNGRGQPVAGTGFQGSQALVRISRTSGVPEVPGGPGAVEGFGTQVQDHAVFGQEPEAEVTISYSTVNGSYGDGTPYILRKPSVSLKPRGGRKLPGDVLTSLRVPPPVFGLGLLEAVTDEELLKNSDPEDANGDGISGHPNYVWDRVLNAKVIGRFGRKANTPTLVQQAATAYAEDMGVSNPLFPNSDGSEEVTQQILDNTAFYTQTLAVPIAAVLSAQGQRGFDLFSTLQCASCHVPRLHTGAHPVAAVANQTIFPYTDMLLHDMGSGLADNRPDFEASGTEWRTTPLWGIGVTATILSSTANFLHDGRAKTLEEAILWHGGEAEGAKEGFRTASADDRQALIAFLKSL